MIIKKCKKIVQWRLGNERRSSKIFISLFILQIILTFIYKLGKQGLILWYKISENVDNTRIVYFDSNLSSFERNILCFIKKIIFRTIIFNLPLVSPKNLWNKLKSHGNLLRHDNNSAIRLLELIRQITVRSIKYQYIKISVTLNCIIDFVWLNNENILWLLMMEKRKKKKFW